MAITTRVYSRIPEIIGGFPEMERDLSLKVAEAIAEDAAPRAPVTTGALRDSLEGREGSEGIGVYALFYWFLVEFGSVNQPANPFLLPAAELIRSKLIETTHDVMGDL